MSEREHTKSTALIRRADLYDEGAPIDTEDALVYAIADVRRAKALQKKFGTSVLKWDEIEWNDAPDGEVMIGRTKVTNLKGKKVKCYVLGSSKDRRAIHLFYDFREWRAFVKGVHNLEFEVADSSGPRFQRPIVVYPSSPALPSVQRKCFTAPNF